MAIRDVRFVAFSYLILFCAGQSISELPDLWYNSGLEHYALENYTTARCTAPLSLANATCTYLIAPDYSQDMQNVSWTLSVTQPADEIGNTNMSLYLSTPSGEDFALGDLEFSACAFVFEGLPENLIRRGQSDDGSCDMTFSKECVEALTVQASNTGSYLTENWQDNSPAPSNLSAGSLPRVCNDIRIALEAPGAVPSACAQFVGPQMTWFDSLDSNISMTPIEITGPNATMDLACSFNTTNTTFLPSGLPIQNSNLSLALQYATPTAPENATVLYDNAMQNVLPVLMVTFPPANDTRTKQIGWGDAYMTCLRAVNVSTGSRVAPPLPAPTGLRHISKPLSRGAIAGITVGIVVALVLISMGIEWIWWLPRRRKRREAVRLWEEKVLREKGEREMREEEIGKEAKNPMIDSQGRHEIAGKGGRGELDGGLVNELEGSGIPELDAAKMKV